MHRAGCRFKFWVADWFGWINNKYDGDLDKIKTAGKYFIEVWKACGMDTDKVEFLWASDFVNDGEYWKKVIMVARNTTLKRVLRTTQIMGRSEKDELSAAQIFYPCMQCADIFHLEADICQLGMDQRKVNILARELGPSLFGKKPVAVHHAMLMGLQAPPEGISDPVERAIAMKMSKSKPYTAIFMTDDAKLVEDKITKAYCPATEKDNPVLEYCRQIVFEKMDKLIIDRPAKFGGAVTFNSYQELAKAYTEGRLHAADLKKGTAAAINELLEPVRKHFSKGKAAALLKEVQGFEVKR